MLHASGCCSKSCSFEKLSKLTKRVIAATTKGGHSTEHLSKLAVSISWMALVVVGCCCCWLLLSLLVVGCWLLLLLVVVVGCCWWLLVGRTVGWSVGWLVGRLLVGWSIGWSVGWFVGWSVDRSGFVGFKYHLSSGVATMGNCCCCCCWLLAAVNIPCDNPRLSGWLLVGNKRIEQTQNNGNNYSNCFLFFFPNRQPASNSNNSSNNNNSSNSNNDNNNSQPVSRTLTTWSRCCRRLSVNVFLFVNSKQMKQQQEALVSLIMLMNIKAKFQ